MPPVPVAQAGSSMVHMIAMALLVLGVSVAVMAMPAVRRKASEHVEQMSAIVHGTVPTQTAVASVKEEDTTAEPVRRREIDDFDFSLFES